MATNSPSLPSSYDILPALSVARMDRPSAAPDAVRILSKLNRVLVPCLPESEFLQIIDERPADQPLEKQEKFVIRAMQARLKAYKDKADDAVCPSLESNSTGFLPFSAMIREAMESVPNTAHVYKLIATVPPTLWRKAPAHFGRQRRASSNTQSAIRPDRTSQPTRPNNVEYKRGYRVEKNKSNRKSVRINTHHLTPPTA